MLRLASFLAALAAIVLAREIGQPVKLAAVPLDMHNVRLDPSSLYGIAQQRNLEYLLSLDNVRLTCLYTSAANLTGTFEHPTCSAYAHPQYWGHYLGHYLSATAQMYASTGNTTVRDKGADVVKILQGCQQEWETVGQFGFLFPYSPVAFENLENPPGNCKPVCVPFYVLHKMMAGLLDQYQLAGNAMAFDMVKNAAVWVRNNVESVLARGGEALWQSVLDTEWGGMNEVLYNLYAVTGDENIFRTAAYFNHWSWSAPLAANVDDLTSQHANTHIPEITGEAVGYELTGNKTQHDITVNFFNILNSTRTFATGGSNDYEHWGAPFELGTQLNSQTEESCTQYNILKVARHMFLWTADSSYFDFYERAILNGLIGNQNRLNPAMTSFIYMLPLGPASTKPWGISNDDFPCCWGTLSETFSKLTDSIYFQSPDSTILFINQFVSSTVEWSERGLHITQSAGFPASTTSTTTISFGPGKSPVRMGNGTWTLAIRVPFWAYTGNNLITINGVSAGAVQPGQYFTITREWAADDTVVVHFPMALRAEPLKDHRPEWASYNAIMYGPVLLTGLTASSHLIYDPNNVQATVTRTSSTELLFKAQDYCNNSIIVKPLMDIVLEEYTVYFNPTPATSTVHFSPNGSPFDGNTTNIITGGGAGIVDNNNDKNIRSGDPGETNTVVVEVVISDPSHLISGISFSYRYVSGYGPAGRHVGANFSVVIGDLCDSRPPTVVYESPELTQYPFDVCNDCYSPPVPVDVRGLSISVSSPSVVKFVFQNNDRNLQLLLPLHFTINWN